jgi:WD40 repeat protein
MFQHARVVRAGVTSAVFSPDGTRVATGGAGDKIVNLWNTEPGSSSKLEAPRPSSTASSSFSPDGARILVGTTRR